jgi:uncharacterized integral membrane protein
MSIRPRTLVVLPLLVLIGAFAALNWGVFTASTTLNILIARVEAPLGLVMLGVVAVLTALYALFTLSVEASALLETRRYARQLEVQRKLAADAEGSRFQELRNYLEGQLAALRAVPGATPRDVIARLELTETTLKGELERVGNTLAAYIGELEDRLIRGGQQRS